MHFTAKIEKALIFEVILFCGGIAAISVYYENNLLLTALLAIAWIIGIKAWHKKHDIYFLLAGAVIGSIGEIVCVHSGAWQYTNPSFLGIPMWLPFVWGLAVVLVKRFAEIFIKIEMK